MSNSLPNFQYYIDCWRDCIAIFDIYEINFHDGCITTHYGIGKYMLHLIFIVAMNG